MNEYVISLCVGVGLAASVGVGYFVSLLAQWLWSIIDEAPMGNYNWFVHQICKLFGCELRGNGTAIYTHRKKSGEGTDGDGECFLLCLALFCVPITVWTSIQFYPIALTVATTVGIVALARFSRRTFKRLVKHEKNPNAHKEV